MEASKLSKFTTTKAMLWLLAAMLLAVFVSLAFRTQFDEIQVRFVSSNEESDVGFSLFTVTNASAHPQLMNYKVFVREPVGWCWTGVQAGGTGLHPSPAYLQLRAGESSEIDIPVFEQKHPWRLRLSYVRPTGLAKRRMAVALKLRKSMPRLSAMIQPQKMTVETIYFWGPEMHFTRPAERSAYKEKLPTW